MSTNTLITFIEGQKIKASETNANNNFLLDEITSQINSLRTELTNLIEDYQSSASAGVFAVGDIKLAPYDTVPDNFLVCDGSSLLIEDYEELYNVIGAIYGQDDDYHFNLPDLRDRVPEGFKDTSEAFGSYQSGTAPNIKGSWKQRGGDSSVGSGAIYLSGTSNVANYDKGSTNSSFVFDASRSSSVYSNSATRITVDRVKMNYLIRYK